MTTPQSSQCRSAERRNWSNSELTTREWGSRQTKLPPGASDEEAKKVFANVVGQMLELSKCPDFIVNGGHYFGTDKFTGGESGLSDADKRALIAFLKTF